jgi:uncharacterized phage protein (TIGR02216 family)
MSARFADTARGLSGMAALMLGWRPHEFWAATPDELAAILTASHGQSLTPVPPDPATINALRKAFPDG